MFLLIVYLYCYSWVRVPHHSSRLSIIIFNSGLHSEDYLSDHKIFVLIYICSLFDLRNVFKGWRLQYGWVPGAFLPLILVFSQVPWTMKIYQHEHFLLELFENFPIYGTKDHSRRLSIIMTCSHRWSKSQSLPQQSRTVGEILTLWVRIGLWLRIHGLCVCVCVCVCVWVRVSAHVCVHTCMCVCVWLWQLLLIAANVMTLRTFVVNL